MRRARSLAARMKIFSSLNHYATSLASSEYLFFNSDISSLYSITARQHDGPATSPRVWIASRSGPWSSRQHILALGSLRDITGQLRLPSSITTMFIIAIFYHGPATSRPGNITHSQCIPSRSFSWSSRQRILALGSLPDAPV